MNNCVSLQPGSLQPWVAVFFAGGGGGGVGGVDCIHKMTSDDLLRAYYKPLQLLKKPQTAKKYSQNRLTR